MPRPSPPPVGAEAPRAAEPTAPADGNVAVGSHAQYVPMLTAAAAWCVNAAVNKAAWPGDLDLDLGPMYATDRRQAADSQTSDSIIA